MSTQFDKHSGFLELLVVVDRKIQIKLIKQASDEELEAILDCFVNVEPYKLKFKNCTKLFQKFQKIFGKKSFTLRKARALFLKNLTFVTSIISVILSEYVNSDVNPEYNC